MPSPCVNCTYEAYVPTRTCIIGVCLSVYVYVDFESMHIYCFDVNIMYCDQLR